MRHSFYLLSPPQILHFDNGKEFNNSFFEEIKQRCEGMQIIRGRPRHPATQGSVESANKQVERMIAAEFEETGSRDWPSMLPGIMWAMNTTDHEAHNKTPFQVVFGQKARKQVICPGTTYEEQPIIDEEEIEDLIDDSQPEANDEPLEPLPGKALSANMYVFDLSKACRCDMHIFLYNDTHNA